MLLKKGNVEQGGTSAVVRREAGCSVKQECRARGRGGPMILFPTDGFCVF